MPSRSQEFWQARYRAAAGTSIWGVEPNGWIARQVTGLAPGAALDLGSGEGRNALHLASLGWSVVAVDFAPAAVEGLAAEAERRGAAVEAVVGDATTWATEQRFDLAVLCYLQLPPEQLTTAVGAAAAALRPGGTLLGIWHDREDLVRGLGGTMTPAIRTTPEETAAAAEAAGLSIAVSDRRDRPVAAGLACDCLLVARR